ncbi:protein of unknown function [Maridesulfovibrio hydrothermalis AM13 = DSM 14728]|uniref:Uncharacterized protein n=1 Tax=Maridesulfovibrio hydrothermalis AM13 = DSM 14728 TaxID=1121451 RepID=L0REQ0_9BACT|nr:protein of unknown function [Maridesulfovibrio hydrothermalis AM13 = DSM 14728]
MCSCANQKQSTKKGYVHDEHTLLLARPDTRDKPLPLLPFGPDGVHSAPAIRPLC